MVKTIELAIENLNSLYEQFNAISAATAMNIDRTELHVHAGVASMAVSQTLHRMHVIRNLAKMPG